MSKQVKFRTHKSHVKFDSIKDMAQATGVPYMTLYMRMHKLGMTASEAAKKPVRQYQKRLVRLPSCDVFGPMVGA